MNDSLFVGLCQSMSDLDRVVDRFANRQRAALQHLTEGTAFQQLGHDVGTLARGLTGRVDRLPDPLTKCPVMVDACEAEVLERARPECVEKNARLERLRSV